MVRDTQECAVGCARATLNLMASCGRWHRLNGGPGSSSLIGLLTENGQIAIDTASLNQADANGIPRLFCECYFRLYVLDGVAV